MDQEPGFHPAEQQVDITSLIRPWIMDRDGSEQKWSIISSATGLEAREGDEDSDKVEDVDVEVIEIETETDEARQLRTPHNPGRPTKKEIEDHLPLHWPFRSWCRHCVCGRAVASPHRQRTEVDRAFAREKDSHH